MCLTRKRDNALLWQRDLTAWQPPSESFRRLPVPSIKVRSQSRDIPRRASCQNDVPNIENHSLDSNYEMSIRESDAGCAPLPIICCRFWEGIQYMCVRLCQELFLPRSQNS